jgi:hypothetical protein
VNAVGFDVGTRSRRRASAALAPFRYQDERSRASISCSTAFGHPAQHSRRRIRPRVARFTPGARTRLRRRDAPSGGPRLRREAQGVSAAPGRAARPAASKPFKHRRRQFNSNRGHKAAPTQTRPHPSPCMFNPPPSPGGRGDKRTGAQAHPTSIMMATAALTPTPLPQGEGKEIN